MDLKYILIEEVSVMQSQYEQYRKEKIAINHQFQQAVQKGNAAAVKQLLLSDKVDVNLKFETLIYGRGGNGMYCTVSALFLAVDQGNVGIVKALLADPRVDLDIGRTDIFWELTAIEFAKFMGNHEIANLIREEKASRDSSMNEGFSFQKDGLFFKNKEAYKRIYAVNIKDSNKFFEGVDTESDDRNVENNIYSNKAL